MKNKIISFPLAIIIVLIISGGFAFWFRNYVSEIKYSVSTVKIEPIAKPLRPFEKKERPKPGPVSMDRMKKQGCVADGILSGYGEDTENAVAMINRSNCYYLHRALETWASPPDFGYARQIMDEIKKPGIVYGMFIAEAIRENADYFYPNENRNFDFSEMCRKGSDNAWGEHTCRPNFKSEEYRNYIKYITQEAMDLGIQSFLFGQIYYQESGSGENYTKKIISDMRKYAKKQGIQIVIGAQTGSITDEKYLRLFDYIEGGVGIDAEGNIEDGPCWSRKESCWALLWNDRFSQKANNVFLHLDWSGLLYDDMGVFAKMDKNTRSKTLKNLYRYFTSKNMGFMMPYMATLHRQNGGCYGPKKRFYSADNKYSCKDEDAIREIMSQAK
ncbi:MAG TPA: hypothetical protein P5262_04145 [Candidatus Moranbacteria bacterium]|nr:hypothetical protein [Candidatus Moranbacteria bacterium]